jgi:sugar phosphate isomerase/epimerase
MNTIGLTYDEAPFKYDAACGIRSFAQIGFTHFELAVDPIILPLNVYKSTVKIIEEEKCSFSFHVPNFLKEKHFRPHHFRVDARVVDCYVDQLETVSLIADSNAKRRYVIHGWEYESPLGAEPPSSARDGMVSFLDTLQNHIERRRLPIELYIENSYSTAHRTYPETLSEVSDIISMLDGYGIKSCLDIPHFLTLENDKSRLCSAQVISDHIHIHGLCLNPYSSHFPISSMADAGLREELMDVLRASLSPDESNTIVLEILGLSRDAYLQSAGRDLDMIREAIGL